MKKQLLAVAVLGAIAAPAFAADNPVTIYGVMNVNYSYADNAAFAASNELKQSRVDSGNTGSRIGFKGEESLGGNTKAFFVLETGIRPDDAASGAFGSREAWVGLSGDFGKFGLGRGKSPYTNLVDVFDIAVGNGDLAYSNDKNGLNGVVTSRFNNAIRYDSPNFSGFSGSLMYGAGENKTATNDATQNWSGAARFATGPVMASLAFNSERHVGGVNSAKNSAVALAATYKVMSNFTLGAAFQNAMVETSAVEKERNYFTVMSIYSIDKLDLRAAAIFGGEIEWTNKTANRSNDVDGTDTVRFTLGAQYNLSKRTGVYVEYNGDNFDRDATGSAVTSNAFGTLVSNTNKGDGSFFNVGIIHKF